MNEYEWMNEWMEKQGKERCGELENEWMNEWMNGKTEKRKMMRWTRKSVNKWMEKQKKEIMPLNRK